MIKPFLIIFGGLPGVGKTTIAKLLAQRIKAVYLRVDTIEKTISERLNISDIGKTGYDVMINLARENLELRQNIITDCVNPVALSRHSLQNISKDCLIVEVEIICSDKNTHQNRIIARGGNPTWENVQSYNFEPWTTPHFIIDSCQHAPDESVALIIDRMKEIKQSVC